MNNGTMINKVFLSGVITGRVEDLGLEDQAKHVVFDLTVPHRTREGEEKNEVYRINAWNGCAKFCMGCLETGMVGCGVNQAPRNIRAPDADHHYSVGFT